MKSIAGKRSRAPHGVCAYLHEPARHCMVINDTYEVGVNTHPVEPDFFEYPPYKSKDSSMGIRILE